MATIQIPTPLRKFTNQQSKFETSQDNVQDAIQELVQTYPELEKNLLDDNGNVRSFVNVFVSNENIKSLNQEQTAVKKDDTINLVPAIAGGNRGIRSFVKIKNEQ